MTGHFVRSFAAGVAALLISAGAASARTPVLSDATVNGSTVTFNWTPTAGATGYRLEAGIAPSIYSGSLTLGAVTTYVAPGVGNGVYFVRVVALTAGGDVPSNEVRLQLPAPPAPPTNLQVVRNGTAVVAAWTPGVGGGAATGYQLRVGLTAGATDASIPVVGTTFSAGPVPANTFFFRVVAVNAAGASTESNEVTVVMPAGGACDAPPTVTFSQFTFSSYLRLSWAPVPGASGYLVSGTQDGVPLVTDQAFPPTFTSFGATVALGTYTVTVKARFACGSTGAPATTTLVVDGAPPPGLRTPNPPPAIGSSAWNYAEGVIQQYARERPDLLQLSCVGRPGHTNRFMFDVLQRLRQRDTRWGLNVKRCNEGLSQDIVAFNVSALPDEGASTNARTGERNMRLWDIMSNHCPNSGNPAPFWQDVTDITLERGACAKWTLLPYLDAGYTP